MVSGVKGEHNLAVRLVTPDGDPLPHGPGAHIDLHLANGVTRQYSLTGSHRRLERYLICVVRSAESRGGSRYIHETLRPGQRLMISATTKPVCPADGATRHRWPPGLALRLCIAWRGR